MGSSSAQKPGSMPGRLGELIASQRWRDQSWLTEHSEPAGDDTAKAKVVAAMRQVVVTHCAKALGRLRISDGVNNMSIDKTSRARMLQRLSDPELVSVCDATKTQSTFEEFTQPTGCSAILTKDPVTKAHHLGTIPCVMGVTFGCAAESMNGGGALLWTRSGCRGRFSCKGLDTSVVGMGPEVMCGNARGNASMLGRDTCPCHRYLPAALEINLTERADQRSWWVARMAAEPGGDPGSHVEHLPAGPLRPNRPISCELVLGATHGYGAFLSSAISSAWDIERHRGNAPLLQLPPWLANDLAACNLTTTSSSTLWSALAPAAPPPVSRRDRKLSALRSLYSARPQACASRYLTCFTTTRRGCFRPGPTESSASRLWSSRLGSRRPSQPLGGAPFETIAEYSASLLRPNAAFVEHFLAPILERVDRYRPALAIHLRYGDSCVRLEEMRSKRRCGPIEEYVAAATRLHTRYTFRSIVLASDSARAERTFRRLWAERTPVFSTGAAADAEGDELESRGINFERSIHGQLMSGGRATATSCLLWEHFADFMVDLHAVAACDGLVGKLTSNFDRLALALMSARLGRVPPFISLDNSTYCQNAISTWGVSAFGAFPCRTRTMDDPPDEDHALTHQVGPDGKARLARSG